MSGRHARVREFTSSDRRRRRRRAVAAVVGVAVVAASLLVAPVPSYASATFLVTSSADEVDAAPGDGFCATDAGVCTLRAAVQEANTSPVVDTITVPAGTYALTREPGGSNEDDTGDLDVVAPLIVVGAGAATTSVVGGPIPQGAPPEQLGMDRILEITDTAGSVSISGLTLRDGWSAEEGGAVLNASVGTVTLTDVVVRDSDSQGEGGGIHHVQGSLHLVDSTISGNTARGGGGLYVAGEVNPNGVAARATLTRTTLRDNTADAGAGASVEHEGDLDLRAATVTENHANAHGGGVSVTSKASLTVVDGSFVENSTNGDGGGLYASTESAVSVTGTRFEGNVAGAEEGGEVPDGSGGGLAAGGMGALTVSDAVFTGNSASAEGGGAMIDNNGSVTISDTEVTGNHAHAGGGLESAGARVTLRNLTITGNEAEADGGGIESNGSGSFTIIDTTISGNTAENGGGIANAADGALRVEKTLIWDNRALQRTNDDTGLGGGVYSLGDASALYENVTIAGNIAQVRGGGLYVDADAPVVVTSTTIAHNSAPIASGVGGEIGSPNVPIQPSAGVILRNTIVADNELARTAPSRSAPRAATSRTATRATSAGPWTAATPPTAGLDAVADRGGATMTMGITPDSLALDGGVTPCPNTDQRGVARPQNSRCDTGAFESEGPFPAPDDTAPDTTFVAGPIQDTLTTSLFRFTGTDDVTAPEDLRYECRLLESDPTEPPEPPDPTQPLPPEFQFVGCGQPWQVHAHRGRLLDLRGPGDRPRRQRRPDAVRAPVRRAPRRHRAEHRHRGEAGQPEHQLRGDLHVLGHRQRHARRVRRVRVPHRHPRPGGVARVHQPGRLQQPGARRAHLPGARDRRRRQHRPEPGHLHVDRRVAGRLRRGQPDPDRDGGRDRRRGHPARQLRQPRGVDGAVRRARCRRRSLVRFDLPAGLPPCELESATLRLYGEGDAGRVLLGGARRHRVGREHRHVEQPAGHVGRCRRRRRPAAATASST